MDKLNNLDEKIRRAQQEVESWNDQTRSMMRLQGSDNFAEKITDSLRFKSNSSALMLAEAQ